MSGLVLVTTPIGNLGDLTQRAREALQLGQFFLCEDTRNTRNLFSLLGLSLEGKQFIAFHDHSTSESLEKIITEMKQGRAYVLVSDAGSPMISDPAFPLVKRALEENIPLDSCPGASAPVLALELSGLPTSPFSFHGFLGREKKDRDLFFQKIAREPGTHLYFEGASRVEETVEEMATTFPEAQMVVARELTKKFQSVYRFLGKDYPTIKKEIMFKGEFVVLIHIGKKEGETLNEKLIKEQAQEILKTGNKPKTVAKLLSSILGIPTKELYQQLSQDSE